MKRIIITVFISIICCLLIIVVKDEYQNILLKDANYGKQSLIKKNSIDNLFIGSSLFRQGIDLNYLNNKNSYVLSYNGMQPIIENYLLNNLIENNLEIKNLYIDLYPYILTDEPSISDGKFFLELNIKEKWEIYKLINNSFNFQDFWNIFVSENNELLLSWPIYYNLVNNTYNNGSLIDNKNGKTEEEINQINVLDVEPIVKQVQVDSIIELIRLCKENNINLVFIETPKYKNVIANENYNILLQKFIKILDDNDAKYLLQSDINDKIKNDSENFFDLLHLSSKGKETFTKSLNEYIK